MKIDKDLLKAHLDYAKKELQRYIGLLKFMESYDKVRIYKCPGKEEVENEVCTWFTTEGFRHLFSLSWNKVGGPDPDFPADLKKELASKADVQRERTKAEYIRSVITRITDDTEFSYIELVMSELNPHYELYINMVFCLDGKSYEFFYAKQPYYPIINPQNPNDHEQN